MTQSSIQNGSNSSTKLKFFILGAVGAMFIGCSDDSTTQPSAAVEDPAEHACLHIKEASGTFKKVASGEQMYGDEKTTEGLWEFDHLRYDVQLTGTNPYMGSAWFETHEEGEILLFSASQEVPVVRTLPDSIVVIPDTTIMAPSACPEIKFYSTYDLPKGKVLVEWKKSTESTAKIVLEEGGAHVH